MKVSIVLVAVAVVFMAVILEALRRRRLSEGYALLWISVGVGALLLAVSRPVVDWLSRSIGIAYGPTMVFAGSTVVLFVICLNLTIHITRLESRVERLGQELALREALADRESDGMSDDSTRGD